MKKVLLFIFTSLLFFSCDESTPEPLETKQILEYHIKSSDWKEFTDSQGLNRYYSYHFNSSEFTSFIFDKAGVIGTIRLSDKQQALPYIRHYQNDKGYLWTRTVDYEYDTTGITFFVTNSDFAVDKPEDMDFRIMLFW